MPTTASRARRWVKSSKATPFFKRGIFCVRLNRGPSGHEKQEIAVGIDPGSKKEGFTVKSEAHTFLNIQADAVHHVKDAVEVRRNMRRTRRSRKTPCRANRKNHARGCLPPSTKARWQWKLRIVEQLAKVFPITDIVVEDIKARTKGKRRWDRLFSPLEVGKARFYEELKRFGDVHLKQGWETKELRDVAGLEKSKSKMSEVFEAHFVDSWVLANWHVGGHVQPDNKRMLCISPIRLHRRQLHMLQAAKGAVRKAYGSTRSCGLKRGSLVTHPKFGLAYVGGIMAGKISLHAVTDGKRLTQTAKPSDVRFKSYNAWRTRLLPALKGRVSAATERRKQLVDNQKEKQMMEQETHEQEMAPKKRGRPRKSNGAPVPKPRRNKETSDEIKIWDLALEGGRRAYLGVPNSLSISDIEALEKQFEALQALLMVQAEVVG